MNEMRSVSPRGGESRYIYMISCDISHDKVGKQSTTGTLPLQNFFSYTVHDFVEKKYLANM